MERSWQSGLERADNIYFWNKFMGEDNSVFIENTDGICKGVLFEFKNSISDINPVLTQAIHYLSKIRAKGGIPVPSKIVLIDIAKNAGYVYDATKYKSAIAVNYVNSASKDVKHIVIKDSTKPIDEFIFDVDNPKNPINTTLKKYFDITEYQSFDIEFPNILGWAKYIYKTIQGTSKSKMFELLRKPEGTCLDGLFNSWKGKESDYSNIMDCLNDPENAKKLGAFYTPDLLCEKGCELVEKAVGNLPSDMDYVIIDRCAGTGNLEAYLSDELLAHTILNTYEIKEYAVLYNLYADKVLGIIPPLSLVDTTSSLIRGGDALEEEFLTTPIETEYKHKTLKDIIEDKNIAIIGLENPPNNNEGARLQDGYEVNKDDYSYIRRELSKYLSKQDGMDGADAKDLINQFVWSFTHFFMRTPYDSYVVYGPVKYWKNIHLMNKKFVDGFLVNRGNFKATESALLLALWTNEIEDREEIKVKALEIWHNNKKYPTGKSAKAISIPKDAYLHTVKEGLDDKIITIKKAYHKLGDYYCKKRMHPDKNASLDMVGEYDVPAPFATAFDGTLKKPSKKYPPLAYNPNILGSMECAGFCMTAQDIRLTRMAMYRGRGTHLRTDNYWKQAPLFAAKLFPQSTWYTTDIYSTTADRGSDYMQDNDFMRKCTIFMCISKRNHCLSLKAPIGENKEIVLQNELCMAPNAIAYKDIVQDKMLGALDSDDCKIIDTFLELYNLAKVTKQYQKDINYGTYQIDRDINISYKDNNDKTIYINDKVYTKMNELSDMLDIYYKTNILNKLLEYELVK